jgi:hypothetical protein
LTKILISIHINPVSPLLHIRLKSNFFFPPGNGSTYKEKTVHSTKYGAH